MSLSHARCRLAAAAAAASVLLAAAPAAAEHRARLSADLMDHVRAGSPAIDVIVHGTRQELDALAQRYQVRIRKRLRSGAVLRVSAGELEALQRDDAVDHLSADIRYRSAADPVAAAIGADRVWTGSGAGRGLTGRGIGVAMIDSGVDPAHAALAGRIVATVDFTGGDGVDRFGHGTHVAATIAGAAGRLVETQDYRGIASGARIVNLRVLGDDGSGLASDVIEAIDWAIEHRRAYDIRVINLSLGAPVLQPYRDDPVGEAVERAVAAGLVVVAAAGNFGRTADGRQIFGGVTSPANHPAVLTVGAVDGQGTVARADDTVAGYSSRGPTRFDLVLKPDLVAPGSRVVSAQAAGSYLARTYPARHVAGAGADAYMQLSGTSMSAAVVSGAVALLLEQRPRLTPREAKAVLQLTSSVVAGQGLVSMGAGSVNVLAARRFLLNGQLAPVQIGNQAVNATGISFLDGQFLEGAQPWNLAASLGRDGQGPRHRDDRATETVLHRKRLRDLDMWAPLAAATVLWGKRLSNTIVWEPGETVIWGQNNTIIWGQASVETIIWGQVAIDTIAWAQNGDGTIIWGQSRTGAVD